MGVIDNYDRWLELRVVRNELSHEYEDDPEQNAIEINKIFDLKDNLVLYFVEVNKHLAAKGIND